MELHEFEIAQRGAGARGDREALAKGAGGIGAVGEKPADAAGRDDDAIACATGRAAAAFGDEARDFAVFDLKAPRRQSLRAP